MKPASFLIVFQVLTYFVANTYTVIKYRHDLIYVLKVLITLGSAVQVRKTFTCLMVLSTGIGFVLYPFFVYMIQGTLLPLFLYELPYLDWHSVDKADICLVHLRELRAMLNDVSKTADAVDIAAVQKKWEQCMHDHRMTTSFLNNVEDLLGMICLAQVMMGVFTVCDCMLLVVLVGDLYGVITSLSWYRLSLQQQKEYRFIIFRQQRPLGLTAFGFMPLNFESYMSVLKGLYQFFVLAMQYVQ
ncbi:uncharacterized protein LOC125959527 [Anopheles darlingi]|uniref:uncharacterized protein LOC125959527 n=1 Tax=Anopheles darlingi TaxID=43151 RepID=UPI0021001852|nr:uncharacterized protein LOC125959527 [Anopheles darlingi]